MSSFVDHGTGLGRPPVGESIMCHCRYRGCSWSSGFLRADSTLYLDLYVQERLALNQLDVPGQDHLRLIDWFASDHVGYRNLEEERGCEPQSPCR